MRAIRYRLQQFEAILDPAQRRCVVLLATLAAFVSVVEALAVNLIPVFVLILQGPEALRAVPALQRVIDSVGIGDQRSLIIAGGAVVLAAFVIKNALGVGLLALQSRVLLRVQLELAERMFEGYLKAPYATHTARNSAEFVRGILSELGTVFNNVLTPCMTLAAELPVALLISFILFYASPAAAASALAVGALSSWVFYRSVRHHVTDLGRTNQLEGRYALQYMTESLVGIRETKLYGAERFARERAIDKLGRSSRAQYRLNILNQLPRYFNETVGMVGIVTFTFVALTLSARSALLPLLALFAVSVVRLVPSMNRVLAALTSIRFGLPALDKVHRDMEQIVKPAATPAAPAPAAARRAPFERLECRRIAFAYPEGNFRLEVESFSIASGQRVALVGGSGSGKSTFVDLVAGLLVPQAGDILCNGAAIAGDVSSWQQRIGYVSQLIHLLDDSIVRNVAFGVAVAEIDRGRVREALEAARLGEMVASLPKGLDTEVGELGARLSGGQRQRLGIARALYRRPEILILDEGTSALDSTTEAEIAATLRGLSSRMAILVIAHRLSTIRDFDRIDFMEEGKIVASGSFQEVADRVPGFARMLSLSSTASA